MTKECSTVNHAKCLLIAGALVGSAMAAEFPQVEISNGSIRATVYLPDAQRGYYRGTRFDWSGIFSSLHYNGHNYFGPWFQGFDPSVRDFIYEGPAHAIKVGPCSAATGPAEEFSTNGVALGYEEAAAGETFIKIGVGVLRKPDDKRYDNYRLYDIADSGKWNIRKGDDWIEFTQELQGPRGYSYIYRKTARLSPDKPELTLAHSLKNTGRREIRTSVYDHNFLVMDGQPTGPDFTITFPFEIAPGRSQPDAPGAIRGNQIIYRRVLENQDRFSTNVEGFSSKPEHYDIRVENVRTGAGVRIMGDRAVEKINFWSIRTVISPEPFIHLIIPPGEESDWTYTYQFYTVPAQ